MKRGPKPRGVSIDAWIGDAQGDDWMLRAAKHPELQHIAVERYTNAIKLGADPAAAITMVMLCALGWFVKYPSFAAAALGQSPAPLPGEMPVGVGP